MIRVILADDDFLVREILTNSIDWKDLGMEVVAAAEDGQEALDFCIKLRADILLTDIKMPVWSGLEVAFHLLEQNLNTRVILVSGIQDFDYARSALNVQAAAYILKPIKLQEVTAALKKVRDGIEMEFNRDRVIQRMQEKLIENIPAARDLFLQNLALGVLDNSEEPDEKIEYLKLPFNTGDEITVAEAEIDDYAALVKDKSEREIHLLNFTIKGFIDRVLENYQAGGCFMSREGSFVIILNGTYSEKHKMSLVFENILELAEEYNGLNMSIGIGNCVTSFNAVNLSYHEADSALGNKFFTGPGSIIHFGDIAEANAIHKTITDESTTSLAQVRKNLMDQIRSGSHAEIMETLEQFHNLTGNSKALSREYVRGQYLELVIAAYQEFCGTEGEVPDILDAYVKAMRNIIQAETAEETKNQAGSMLLITARYFNDKYSQRNRTSVARVKDYIIKMRKHNLSLNDIANEAYLSPNYMCAVFKRETGQTLNKFIVEDKMNYAKELLRNTKMKILEIAEQLGYDNSHYFSYSFKRHTGLTPQQFRLEAAQK